jgi:hypothetical protein
MKRTDLFALGLALVGGIASFLVADRVFEQLPHLEDEFAYLWEAGAMAEGEAFLPTPDDPKSFLVPFVVDFEGIRFSKYPPGWSAALSVAVRAGAPWLANAIFAGFSIWLTYRLGSKLVGEVVGIVAAGLTVFSPMALMLAGTFLPHTFSLFLTLAFILAWLDIFGPDRDDHIGRGAPGWLLILVTGLSLGLLGVARPLTALAIGIPFAIHGLWILARMDRGERLRLAAISLLVAGMILTILSWNAMLTGELTKNLYTLWWEYDRLGFGPGIGVTDGGHSLRIAIDNVEWSLRSGVHDAFGWPYLSWVFLPFGLFAMRKKWVGWLSFSIFPALVVAYGFYWVGAWHYGPRYYFEALPVLAIVSAVGMGWLGGWLGGADRYERVRKGLVITIVGLLVGGNLVFYLPVNMMTHLFGITRSRLEAFEMMGVERGLVIAHSAEDWRTYGNLLPLSPPFTRSELILVISRGVEVDEAVAASYPNLPTYHYYPDEPDILFTAPR